MIARTPKARQSVFGVFGQAVSPPGNASAAPVTPSNGRTPLKKTPVTVRHVSSSSALREQMAKARTARQSDIVEDAEQSPKIGGSSNALREQIAKAKEAARRAKTETVRTSTPPRDPILPDPNEIATFDFGLDDPFNQVAKGSKSVLRKRIDGGRVDGRLNIAAMSLTEIPEAVLQMYKYDANDTTVAWGEIVDLTSIIAADNELELLPDAMFPDVDPEAMEDSDEGGPQFGAVQNMDLHGNVLRELPLGLKRLTQLSRLNLVSKNLSQALVMRLDRRTQSRSLLASLANLMQSRNKLPVDVLDIISEIASLRELKLAENDLQGALPVTIAKLTSLEVLELQGNKLTSLPIEIGKLTCLRLMNVSNNQLLNIPMELFETSLLELVANKNQFEDAFFSIEFVPNLQELNISNNSLKRLCEGETLNLPALKSLNLSMNRLTSLPSVESWVNLQTLVAGENKVTAFPEGFTSLPNLRTADFTANDITQIDEKIALMPLEHLTLAANPLRERKFLTMSFDDMKRALASRLAPEDAPAAEEIGGEGLIEGTVPGTQGWQVTPSGTLDLSAKSLTELDESALSVVADDIRQLYLQQNAFESIPMALSQITFLTVLDLSKNNIATILTSPLFLPRLKELRLNGNKLASLDHLTTRLAAPSLQTLDISNNRLTGTLPALRSSYPALISLIACDNTISEVPAESLSGLKIVNLSNNDIERLEPQIGHLAGTLTSLNVEGNKFRVPNYQLLQKGTDAVLAYLRDRIPRESWVSEKSDATVFFDADDGAEV
jgi:Leucine-rich repeat (LRR) protein